MQELLAKARQYFGKDPLRIFLTIILTALFIYTVLNETNRTAPIASFLWGAITFNTPMAVLLFYVCVMIFLRQVNFRFTKGASILTVNGSRDKALSEVKALGKNPNIRDTLADAEVDVQGERQE